MKIEAAKEDARILKAYLKSQGISLTHSIVLEAVARLARHKNWATLVAQANEEARLAPNSVASVNWPVYVCFIHTDEDFKETLYFLPLGARLADSARCHPWGFIESADCIPMPKGVELGENFVVTAVHARVPTIEEYGLPWYAEEEKAPRWFREELHCAALDHIEVSLTDSGDDSASEYWFEARVNPAIAKLLEQAQAHHTPQQ